MVLRPMRSQWWKEIKHHASAGAHPRRLTPQRSVLTVVTGRREPGGTPPGGGGAAGASRPGGSPLGALSGAYSTYSPEMSSPCSCGRAAGATPLAVCVGAVGIPAVGMSTAMLADGPQPSRATKC
eukprot:scaffold175922_cov27-Tisochrysis_lutea.AAC.4